MLEDIGFYTLEDARARNSSPLSPMWRCELILTDKCNFSCPYCRGLRQDCAGVMPLERASWVIDAWCDDGLRNIRFSGGEPLMYPHLVECVERARAKGTKRIAVSTNGSFPLFRYKELLDAGVNDFSISLDACCAAKAQEMSGQRLKSQGGWDCLVHNIAYLSERTYVTVGVVATEQTLPDLPHVIEFAHDLGVSDIRIISAAQWDDVLATALLVDRKILDAHPILKYRVGHIQDGRNVRGLQPNDQNRCHLALDDSVIAGKFHFPCVIYMREGGDPIGEIGPNMRSERVKWSKTHDTYADPICLANCLDVCIDYNNKWAGINVDKSS